MFIKKTRKITRAELEKVAAEFEINSVRDFETGTDSYQDRETEEVIELKYINARVYASHKDIGKISFDVNWSDKFGHRIFGDWEDSISGPDIKIIGFKLVDNDGDIIIKDYYDTVLFNIINTIKWEEAFDTTFKELSN